MTLLLVGVVTFQQIFADTALDELMTRIETLDTEITEKADINLENIIKITDDLDDFWTKKERILCLVINHNDLNNVGEQIKRVKTYIKNNDKENCLVELETLKFYAESYRHVMEINLQNLF